jgi:6-phosphofructokinase
MASERKHFGILVGGGPAPGINSAISAATIEAIHQGHDVVGIEDGYEHLIAGRTDHVRPLTIADVARIPVQGGSILRTSRSNPTTNELDLQRVVETLGRLGVTHLVSIGGEDTAFSSFEVARQAAGRIRVAHVPKTIDNDLPLPAGMPTFGYETARHVGTELVLTLMEDSRTTSRWFVVVVMGRKAGHLALGIGKAAGATLTVIPEEFRQDRITLDDVARVVAGAIVKRRAEGRRDGLAIIAEGVAEKMDTEELARTSGVEIAYDPHGHVSLNDIPLAALIKQRVQHWFAHRSEQLPMVDVTLGYELRCARPIPFDIDYTRTLGYGAVRFLVAEERDPALENAGFLTLEDGRLRVLPFADIRDPVSGKVHVRTVDLNAEHYRVARDYMVRIEPSDLENRAQLDRLAKTVRMSPDEFTSVFRPVVASDGAARVAA